MAAVTNLKSASKFPEVIDLKLSKELRLGRVLGPFAVPPPSCHYRVSPLGVVPKKVAGEFRMIHHSPHLVYMAKVDIESAFRIIPISPADRPFLGFQWRGQFFMDAVLPTGCSSSCAIFECFSTALGWAAKGKLCVTEVVHVIDDFLLLAHSFDKCTHDLHAFITMCNDIGVPLAPEKNLRPFHFHPVLGNYP